MKKGHIVLIVVAVLVAVFIFSPLPLITGGIILDATMGTKAEIEIEGYRLCKDRYGDDVIIVKYLLTNKGKEPTCLSLEGDFYVYQNGVSLTEYMDELPRECNYDTEDMYKNVKGGVSYGAEVAYRLDSVSQDVEVEVTDYGLFEKDKQKTFKLK
ncbi:MAG: DUF5067 domain-containing protein [Clostridia bacterium]|nr:DUF5067 domain-containing protein [Clostridia bacterium]